MRSNDKFHLSNCLTGVKFFRMPLIPYDILFKRQSIKNYCQIEENLYRAPMALLKRAFIQQTIAIEYRKDSEAKVLFYLSDPVRKSNELNFNKVVSTVDHADTLIERHGSKFSLLGFYLLFILMPVWTCQMSGRGLSLVEKIQVLKSLIEVYPINIFFKSINIKKYKLLVCYYDSIVHECLLNLIFKNNGVKTATIQHGQFNAWREDTYVNCGLELLSSPSDYQLCWNKYARNEAVKCGWDKKHLPVVGIMSNIGRDKERCVNPHNKTFGVVICHPDWENENYEMIKAANILSKAIGYKYYLKLHPNYKDDYFGDVVDSKYYVGNIKKGIDTLEYTNMVEFSIVGSTSFFAEMVYFYHDTIRYSSHLPSDKYQPITVGSVFSKADDIIPAFKSLCGNSKQILFDYLCETEDTYSAYRNFMNHFNV